MYDARRRILISLLKIGFLGFAGLIPAPLAAMIKPGLRQMRGDVRVNGMAVDQGHEIIAGDRLTTGNASEATIVIGNNAYLVRAESDVVFPEDSAGVKVLTIVTGSLLSVFGSGALTLNTPLATIGIRGTGVYVEVSPDRDYVCLCYGKAELRAKLNPDLREELDTFHHDAPRIFHADPDRPFMEPAKMINHRDEELILLENLVGRIPLFGPKPITMPQ